ncbi:MAG: hypothetical protein JRI62_07080 [Deltaproteobacteria bacterium]|nr:hypothetical protein [Deltaproteobacteria bacterium]
MLNCNSERIPRSLSKQKRRSRLYLRGCGVGERIKKLIEFLTVEDSLQLAGFFKRNSRGRVFTLYNLTEEEYSLILNETNCPDQIRNAKTSARSMW